MASYRIVITERAVEELRSVPFPFRRQINQKIFKLKLEPRQPASELVTDGRYRLLVSGWWILYEVDEEAALVKVAAIVTATSR
jgi:mRNA-degrading endonuclease RelE of RelBE toxin-antitoxin system